MFRKDLIPASEERVAGRFFSWFIPRTLISTFEIWLKTNCPKKGNGESQEKCFSFGDFLTAFPNLWLTRTPSTAAVKRSRQAFAICQANRQSVKCVFNHFISAGWKRRFWLFKRACSLRRGGKWDFTAASKGNLTVVGDVHLKLDNLPIAALQNLCPNSKVLLASMFPC